jgi:hypothetical protein
VIELVITLVVFPLVGAAAAILLRIPIPRSIATGIAFVFLLGIGVHGAVLFAFGARRWMFFTIPILLGSAATLVAAVHRASRSWRFVNEQRQLALPHSTTSALFFALPLIVLLFAASVIPTRDYDGRVTWLPKARAIALEQSITGPFFHGERGINLHNRYPLLMPTAAATPMVMSGDTRNEAARWIYVLIPIAALIVLRAMLITWFGTTGAWVSAAMPWLGMLTTIEGGALAAYNDFALAAFFGMAVLYLIASLDDPLALRAVGLFTAFALLTKNEGAVLAIAMLVAAVVVRRLKWLWLLAPVVVAEGIVMVWRRLVPAAYDEQYEVLVSSLPASLDRVPSAIAAFAKHAVDFSEWGIFWIALIVAIVSLGRRVSSPVVLIPLITITVPLAAYIAALAVTSWSMDDLAKVAVNRLLVHLLVPAAYILTLALRKTEPSSGVTTAP